MMYDKTFSTFIDVLKGISIGSFVASMVGYLLQDKSNSWFLAVSGIIFFIIAMFVSLIYDRRKGEKDE